MGARAVLLKGGHLPGDEVVDCLLTDQGQLEWFKASRVDTRNMHGTGCTLSAAITARLARGEALEAAVAGARAYIRSAISRAPGLGGGCGPVDHFAPVE